MPTAVEVTGVDRVPEWRCEDEAGRGRVPTQRWRTEDISTLSCTDDETHVQLLLENESVSIVGSRIYNRTELVEWSEPVEADFLIPPQAREALEADPE